MSNIQQQSSTASTGGGSFDTPTIDVSTKAKLIDTVSLIQSGAASFTYVGEGGRLVMSYANRNALDRARKTFQSQMTDEEWDWTGQHIQSVNAYWD
ncbi:hypothetical protein IAT38_004705 [Cryptococcus sp. DSM 104549]